MERKLFISFLLLCLITHIVRLVYEVLKHRKKLIPSQRSFIVILVNMILLWVSWFVLCSLDISKIQLPDILRYFGFSLVGIGVLMFLIALSTIKSLESYEGDLITSGIYSKIRHPMYLAFILWLVGWPICFGSVISLMLAILFIGNVLFWRHLEEIELIKRFTTYTDYRKTTWF
jgi:protein-S-isoprenylcysteine O-methyltransferase Ste14